jgi:uncharacterized Fe-S cluster protein YjdI
MAGYVKTYVIDVNTSRTPEEGPHSKSCPNGLIVTIIINLGRKPWIEVPNGK